MTKYFKVVTEVPIFDTLPDHLKLTVDDINTYYGQFPNDPINRLSHHIQPLIDALNNTDGCKAATRWPKFKNKWGRCRGACMPGLDLCYRHGGYDIVEYRKEQIRLRRIERLKAELKELEAEA